MASNPICLSAPMICVPNPNPFCFSYAHTTIAPCPLFFTTERPTVVVDNADVEISMVWADNLHEEFDKIKLAINMGCYTHAALDTEFKLGDDMINRRIHPRFQSPDERYEEMRMRVDSGKIRQIGLTLFSEDDSVVEQVWQFHFKPYNFTEEMEMQKHNFITLEIFSDLLVNSGLIWNESITWVFFHCAYDVAYLLRIAMYWDQLPLTLADFAHHVHNMLGDGQLYDIKYLTSFTEDLSGGLAQVSNSLGVKRVMGRAHDAGSDSLLTSHTFKRMINCYFYNGSAAQHAGIKYGIDAVF